MTHLIRLTSNAPPDVVSKCELTSFAFSISEIHKKKKYQASSFFIGSFKICEYHYDIHLRVALGLLEELSVQLQNQHRSEWLV